MYGINFKITCNGVKQNNDFGPIRTPEKRFSRPRYCEIPPHPKHTRLKNAFFSSRNSFCTSKGRSSTKRQYVRHAKCPSHREATHLPAGIEGVRTHASISLLRTSAGVLCVASNGDWCWKKLLKLVSTDGMILRWEHNKWYTWWGSASSWWADWQAVVAYSPSRR